MAPAVLRMELMYRVRRLATCVQQAQRPRQPVQVHGFGPATEVMAEQTILAVTRIRPLLGLTPRAILRMDLLYRARRQPIYAQLGPLPSQPAAVHGLGAASASAVEEAS